EEASVGGNISATASTTVALTVNPVAEAPSAAAPASLTLSENASSVAVSGGGVGPLAEDSDDTVSATLTVLHGTLHIASAPAGVTVTGNSSGTLVVSGDAAAVNTLLSGLTYTPTGEYEAPHTPLPAAASTNGSKTNTATAPASTSITVNPVAEAPSAAA